MSNLIKCPGCAAEIRFRISSSLVMVCPYCRNVVGRSERGIETWGQFADVVTSESSLELGAGGSFQGKSFVLTGRLQLLHAAGGMWDEWYAYFEDGRWGWLAEGQGRFYLTFRNGTAEHVVPPFSPGFQVVLDGPYVVTEVGTARIARGEGEIPFSFRPGDEVQYADLSGEGGRFATIDYSEDPPPLFLGREVTLVELKMAGRAPGQKGGRAAAAVKVTCPECDGALELRAPDASLRVGCPFCGMLSDVKDGKLSRLQSLANEKFPPAIKLGAGGTLRGAAWTVIGFMRRSVRVGGVVYPWSEYLLRHNSGRPDPAEPGREDAPSAHRSDAGFRWLVESEGHWSFVEPIAAGEVVSAPDGLRYQGSTFKLFQQNAARVDYVVGEFYWRVQAGEKVHAADHVKPPLMISREASKDEVSFSLGAYLTPREVEQAFGAGIDGKLPHAKGIAPNQPYRHGGMYKVGVVLFILGIVAGAQACARTHNRSVMRQAFTLEPVEGPDKTRVAFSDPFELEARSNLRITLEAPVSNAWVFVQGDLVNEETGLVVPFTSTIQYYSGSSGGESWSEGDQSPSVYLAAVPRGTYALRLEAQWNAWGQPQTLTAGVEQGVFRPRWLLILFGLLALPPIMIGFHQYFFEKQRWSESDFSPYQSGDDDE